MNGKNFKDMIMRHNNGLLPYIVKMRINIFPQLVHVHEWDRVLDSDENKS